MIKSEVDESQPSFTAFRYTQYKLEGCILSDTFKASQISQLHLTIKSLAAINEGTWNKLAAHCASWNHDITSAQLVQGIVKVLLRDAKAGNLSLERIVSTLKVSVRRQANELGLSTRFTARD